MGSLGLITAHISKARMPIKTDRAQYGLLGSHGKEQHIQHENQFHPLVRRNSLSASDPRGVPNKYVGSTRGHGGGKGVESCGVIERRDLRVTECVCVCVGVC